MSRPPSQSPALPAPSTHVALLATCVANVVRPQAARAALMLLRHAGCRVTVPAQGCCGQPAFNAGHETQARHMAHALAAQLADFDAIVVPSASCAGMLRNHFGSLLGGAGQAVASRTFELCSFLEAAGADLPARRWRGGPVLWHDSCASLREVPEAATAALALLQRIDGLKLLLADEETRQTCCGFGGLFSVKQPELSVALARRRIEAMLAALPDGGEMPVLTGPDMGCLMHLGTTAEAIGAPLRVMHVAEILAGGEADG